MAPNPAPAARGFLLPEAATESLHVNAAIQGAAFYPFPCTVEFMRMQLRAMVDTNVYELLHLGYLNPLTRLIEEGKIVAYGCRVVRKELRDIPTSIKRNGKSFRNILLSIYDELTENHEYQLESVSENLAAQYLGEYEGGIPKRKLMADFRIVAISSLHNLDIIVSEDSHSMKSGHAVRAFLKVNNAHGFRTPAFYSMKELTP